MRFITAILILMLVVSGIPQLPAQSAEHIDSLTHLVSAYYEINLKIFQSNSTPENIHSLFEIFTDDFTYVHERYGGTYSRQDLLDGYLNNQQAGRYDGSIADVTIHTMVPGLNAMAVRRSYIERKPDGLSEQEAQLTVFEFRAGKIFRITEYW